MEIHCEINVIIICSSLGISGRFLEMKCLDRHRIMLEWPLIQLKCDKLQIDYFEGKARLLIF
jgi:hypothetical protein